MANRVVVTGMGALTPLGNDVDSFWAAVINGKSGIRPHPDANIQFPVGWVNFDFASIFSRIQLNGLDRVSQMAMVAADQAMQSAGFEANTKLLESAGVFLGTGMGGAESVEHAYAKFFGVGGEKKKLLTIPAAMVHAASANVSLRFGVTGESQTYSTACSSSAVAIGEGFRRIRDGYLSTALVGGAECLLVPGVLDNWRAMRVLCDDPTTAPGTGCRPFSRDRSGFAIGEGAAVLVVESLDAAQQRGAMPLCEILGYGVSNDATHITKPSAAGQSAAMIRALEQAALPRETVDHVNAHGTATTIGDRSETEAIKLALGNRAYQIPVSATKSAHGHLMGATAAVEFVASVKALQTQIVPPTTHWRERDPECDLDYVPGKGRLVESLDNILFNSFAFGGNNASLVVKRWSSINEL